MNLLEMQRRMYEDVSRPLTLDHAMQRTTGQNRSVEEIAASYIKPNAQLTAFERLEIYNRQYWFRVIAAVGEDYPALNAILGSKKFDALISAYLKETPSTSWTLRDLSSRLPDFTSAHPEFTERRHRLAVDVAKLEWAYIEAFDGGQKEPLTAENLQAIGPESRIALQPYIRLLELNYPVDDLVLAVHRSTPETDIVSGAAAPKGSVGRRPLPAIKRERIYLAVHRLDDSVYYRRIECETFLLLRALQNGARLAEAIAEALNGTSLTSEQQASLLRESLAHASELSWLCPWPASGKSSEDAVM